MSVAPFPHFSFKSILSKQKKKGKKEKERRSGDDIGGISMEKLKAFDYLLYSSKRNAQEKREKRRGPNEKR